MFKFKRTVFLEEDELVALVADCAPMVLIVDRNYKPRAAALMERCSSLETLIYAELGPT